MKKYLFCLFLLVNGAAFADELGDADRLLDAKSYPQALAAYGKLAQAGNASAQFHLGEMFLYGEAGKVDLAKAEDWFRKAAAGGSAEAGAALDTMRQRAARHGEIEHWTSSYDGSELTSGRFACAAPSIPAMSTDNDEIKRVSAAFASWQDCYNGMVQNVNDALPPGKRIPTELTKLMNQVEYDKAIAHLDTVYASISSAAAQVASAVIGQHAAWQAATKTFVDEANRNTTRLDAERERTRLEREAQRNDTTRPIARGKGG